MRFELGVGPRNAGWAGPVLSSAKFRVEMVASYVTSAFDDFFDAVLALLNGAPMAACIWNEEPAEWVWRLVRENDLRIRIRVEYHAEGVEAMARGVSGREVLDTTTTLREFVRAVAQGGRRSLDELGDERLGPGWGAPFPLLQLEALERWLAADAAVPRDDPDGAEPA